MEIRKINKTVDEILKGAEYIGCGASKEAYVKDGIVYKIPRGRYLIERNELNLYLPDFMDDVNDFLGEIYEEEEALVWPIGQFAIELIIWEAIQDLEKAGLDISCFARIKDYYFDANGVIVIEQELTEEMGDFEEDEFEELWSNFQTELKALEPILEEEYNIVLRDVRSGNCGFKDGKIKLFDFGISITTQLDSYGSYSDYEDMC